MSSAPPVEVLGLLSIEGTAIEKLCHTKFTVYTTYKHMLVCMVIVEL